jgi:hypothetical protein
VHDFRPLYEEMAYAIAEATQEADMSTTLTIPSIALPAGATLLPQISLPAGQHTATIRLDVASWSVTQTMVWAEEIDYGDGRGFVGGGGFTIGTGGLRDKNGNPVLTIGTTTNWPVSTTGGTAKWRLRVTLAEAVSITGGTLTVS